MMTVTLQTLNNLKVARRVLEKALPLALLMVLSFSSFAASAASAANATEITSVKETLTPATTNVFRRHEAPAEMMFNFYGKVLGFAQHATYDVGGGGVTNFRVGQSLLKFTYREPEWNYQQGGIDDTTGLRLLTFNVPSESALQARFVEYGFEPPQFQEVDGRHFALLQDPDGQWVELVLKPNQAESFYQQVEIGLTVSNMDASRAFYRDFIGLEELGFSKDHLFPTQRYQFQRGPLTITLRQFGDNLAADTGSGGIQYIVNDAHAVEALARKREVQIDKETYLLEGFNMNFLWLADPDGIINYFAQSGAK